MERPRVWYLAVLLLSGADPVAWAGETSPNLKQWIQGPVRYIATPPEIDAFRSLKEDSARGGFIEAFWSKRDPTPNTLINEFRQLFWERVNEANSTFLDSPGPGWKTDRGKIYILHGAPTRIEDDLFAQTNPNAGRGLIRWFYEGGAEGHPELGPVVVVPFARDLAGEFRLSHDPRLASEFYDWDTIQRRSQYERWLQADLLSTSRSPLAIMLDLGKMQEIPSQEEVILDRVETYEAFGSGPLPLEIQRYRDPSARGIVVSLTVSVPADAADSRPAILARFTPRDATRTSIVLGEESFQFEGEGEDRQAQSRSILLPGAYDLIVLAVIPRSSSSSIHKSVLTLTEDERDTGIRLSDVVLARDLEPLPYESLSSYSEPYIVGSFRVVPRVRDTVPLGEDVALFYEVYGGSVPYRITYRLEGREADGPWVPLGSPVVQDGGQGAQGWSLSTGSRWPLGEYRVQILVEDAGGASQSAQITFQLVAPEPT